jgi:REP element-mobilizing transposase RayT
MKDNTCILECGSVYHIFNRGNNNKDKIFIENENYEFFLRRFTEYISPISEVFCYCLIPNHFHFLLQIKEYHQINEVIPCLQEEVGEVITRQFSNFFNSYSKAFNKRYSRRGKLFSLPFKRIKVDDKSYLTNLVVYIHRNPAHHGLSSKLGDWKYCSFNSIVSEDKSLLNVEYVLNLFGNKNEFLRVHYEELSEFDEIKEFTL